MGPLRISTWNSKSIYQTFTCGFHDQCTFWNPKPLEWQMIAAMTTDIWHQMVLDHFELLKLPGDIGA